MAPISVIGKCCWRIVTSSYEKVRLYEIPNQKHASLNVVFFVPDDARFRFRVVGEHLEVLFVSDLKVCGVFEFPGEVDPFYGEAANAVIDDQRIGDSRRLLGSGQ